VIEAMVRCMEERYANVHRGAYRLSEASTADYEAARAAVARFVNAADPREVIFTTNSTAAINLVAHSWGRGVLKPGQAVLVSEMEHHANLVPWHMLRDEGRGIELRICRVTDAGELDLDDLEAKLADGKVGLVAVTHMSNVLGTVTPAERIPPPTSGSGLEISDIAAKAAGGNRKARSGEAGNGGTGIRAEPQKAGRDGPSERRTGGRKRRSGFVPCSHLLEAVGWSGARASGSLFRHPWPHAVGAAQPGAKPHAGGRGRRGPARRAGAPQGAARTPAGQAAGELPIICAAAFAFGRARQRAPAPDVSNMLDRCRRWGVGAGLDNDFIISGFYI
jgi:hypothetical protein